MQLRLVEGLRHATGPMVRNATRDMSLAPRPPPGLDDPAIRFKPIAHLNQIVVARRGHPLASSRSAAVLVSDEWLTSMRHEVTAEALRSIGVPEPRQITECESFSAMLTLLAESDRLAADHRPESAARSRATWASPA